MSHNTRQEKYAQGIANATPTQPVIKRGGYQSRHPKPSNMVMMMGIISTLITCAFGYYLITL